MKLLIAIPCAAAMAATPLTILAIEGNSNQPYYATAPTAYTCASIHFGMDDDTNQAMTYDCSTALDNLNTVAVVGNVTIASSELTKAYYGGKGYENCALRFGASSDKGSLSITFEESIIGATCYMLGYGADSTTVLINGNAVSLTHNYSDKQTQANAKNETYYPYSVTFGETNTITIVAKNKSKCRFMLADIALRVKV